MTIKRSEIDYILQKINELLNTNYLSNIDKIVARKDQKGYCIEYIINGKQSDSFYSNLTKNQVYIFLQTLESLIYKHFTIAGSYDIEDQKVHNTNLIINLINLWNTANII